MTEPRRRDEADLLQQIREWPWRHRIEVADGVVTPGRENTGREFERSGVADDLAGLRVLDIGCSDGIHSFMAEERGADVVSIDNFLTTPYRNGTCGYRIAHDLRGSNAFLKNMDVYDLSETNPGGRFDVILFFNVLYHLKHPLLALERIRSVAEKGATLHLKTIYCRDVELWAGWGLDISKRPRMRFLESDELNADPTNWWVPNRQCVAAMLRAAGFIQVENTHNRGNRTYYRAVAS